MELAKDAPLEVSALDMAVKMPAKLKISNPLLGNKGNLDVAIPDGSLMIAGGVTQDPDDWAILIFVPAADDGTFGVYANPITVPGIPGAVWPQATHKATDFTVPGATGCGPSGSLNWAVNLRAGLPSAGARNSLSTTSSVYNVGPWEVIEAAG